MTRNQIAGFVLLFALALVFVGVGFGTGNWWLAGAALAAVYLIMPQEGI